MSAVRSVTTAILATAMLLSLGCGAAAPPKASTAPQPARLADAPPPSEGVGTQADAPPLPPPVAGPAAGSSDEQLWIADPGGCWRAVPVEQMKGSFPDLMAAFICPERKAMLMIRVGLYDKTLADKAQEEIKDASGAGFTMTGPTDMSGGMLSISGIADSHRAFAVFKQLKASPQVVGVVLVLWPAGTDDAATIAETTAVAESAHVGATP